MLAGIAGLAVSLDCCNVPDKVLGRFTVYQQPCVCWCGGQEAFVLM